MSIHHSFIPSSDDRRLGDFQSGAITNDATRKVNSFTKGTSSSFPGGLVTPEGLCPSEPEVRTICEQALALCTPLQHKTSNYLWGRRCSREPSIWPRCTGQAQPSLNDTLPTCPLAGVGGEGAWPSLSCGFFFHCVRPQSPAHHPIAGLAQRVPLWPLSAPALDSMCSPF